MLGLALENNRLTLVRSELLMQLSRNCSFVTVSISEVAVRVLGGCLWVNERDFDLAGEKQGLQKKS